jgi:hypothetical protein
VEAGEGFLYGMHRLMAREALGQLYEAQGDMAVAAEHYAVFAEQWSGADADLQDRVRHARDIAGLGG